MTKEYKVKRSAIIAAIRSFFHEQSFIEVDTPTLVLSPGMEPHIRPMMVQGLGSTYLHTSPEFAMKKLIAQGHYNIFQICKAYRAEPKSSTHNPEFTILEWYRTPATYLEIMNDVECLFQKLTGSEKKIPRIKIEECFERFAGVSLSQFFPVSIETVIEFAKTCKRSGFCSEDDVSTLIKTLESEKNEARLQALLAASWDDQFFRVMLNVVEPELAKFESPVIIYDYPSTQAALSNCYTDSRGIAWAKRFEVYAGGFELANAFDELTDQTEQERRFLKDMKLREVVYGADFPKNPIDSDFIKSLGQIPPTGGIALGVDRLAMYLTGAKEISEVLWNPSHYE